LLPSAYVNISEAIARPDRINSVSALPVLETSRLIWIVPDEAVQDKEQLAELITLPVEVSCPQTVIISGILLVQRSVSLTTSAFVTAMVQFTEPILTNFKLVGVKAILVSSSRLGDTCEFEHPTPVIGSKISSHKYICYFDCLI
jgi:hypothetical protein